MTSEFTPRESARTAMLTGHSTLDTAAFTAQALLRIQCGELAREKACRETLSAVAVSYWCRIRCIHDMARVLRDIRSAQKDTRRAGIVSCDCARIAAANTHDVEQ